MESHLLSPLITSVLKSQNNMPQVSAAPLLPYPFQRLYLGIIHYPFLIILPRPASMDSRTDAAADGDPRAPHVLPGLPTTGYDAHPFPIPFILWHDKQLEQHNQRLTYLGFLIAPNTGY
jgi:hypothetical protein